MTPANRIRLLIEGAEADRRWHKSQGHEHGVEAMAASIRLIALRDALACLTPRPGDPPSPPADGEAEAPRGNLRRWAGNQLLV
jgi:hypothetical protein